MKCLATFSLWGDNPIYTEGALKQLRLYNEWSKEGPYEWKCIFYVGDSVPTEYIAALLWNDAFVVTMPRWPEDQTSTFWRFMAFHSCFEEFDAIFSRDCDSRLSKREKTAIYEFLASKQSFHIIRDHPFHGVPVLAGLFGAKQRIAGILQNNLPGKPPEDFYEEVNRFWKIGNWTSNNTYQVDQLWLRLRLYPLMRHHVLAHDDYFGFDRKRYRAYLPEREPGDFIGKGFDENDNPRHPEHEDLLVQWPRKYR